MRVSDEIKKCVCFLCVEDNGVYKYGGTAMILTVKEHADDVWFNYIVTARHCVERAKSRYGSLSARLNLKDGSSQQVKLEDRWFYPDDASVDIAVLPVFIDPTAFDYGTVPKMMIAGDDEIKALNIGIGDDLIIVGLFTQRHGTQRNIPIVRSGIIASMPEEALEDPDTGNPYHAYLIEARSIGGLSGSPVFVVLDTSDPQDVLLSRYSLNEARTLFLLGIIRSHWDLTRESKDFLGDADSKLNMGIAAVTPIQEVMKLISTDGDLVRQRKTFREAVRKRMTADKPEGQ